MTKSKMGPKTEEGRMAVAANAVRHGITSTSPVIEGESREDWQRHLAGIIESLSPEGDLEEDLAGRVASLLWRLHRVTRYQTAETLRQTGDVQDEDEFDEIDPADTYRRQELKLLLDDRCLDRIMRYETNLHRQCLQALHELEALQARRCEQAHLARLDISAGPTAYLSAARGIISDAPQPEPAEAKLPAKLTVGQPWYSAPYPLAEEAP